MSSGFCVFVVDDDASARRGLVRLLRTAGHDVRAFASAQEFLDAFDPEIQGCLVLDIRMPGLSGEELQAKLLSLGIRMPVIVVTGDDDPATKRRAQRMKAAGFFRKPVDGKALLDAIDWALRSIDAGDKNNEMASDERSKPRLSKIGD